MGSHSYAPSKSQMSQALIDPIKDNKMIKQQSMMKFTTKEKSPPSASDIYGF